MLKAARWPCLPVISHNLRDSGTCSEAAERGALLLRRPSCWPCPPKAAGLSVWVEGPRPPRLCWGHTDGCSSTHRPGALPHRGPASDCTYPPGLWFSRPVLGPRLLQVWCRPLSTGVGEHEPKGTVSQSCSHGWGAVCSGGYLCGLGQGRSGQPCWASAASCQTGTMAAPSSFGCSED